MSEIKGHFTLVLHAHLPYVLSHGRWPHGTDWLNEAAAETYLPLLRMFNQLLDEGILPKVTMGLTPILCEQLASPTFGKEFTRYCKNKIAASKKDRTEFRTLGDKHKTDLAAMWLDYYTGILKDFTETYQEDLIGAFRQLQDAGAIEIITCAATHGYLPLLGSDQAVAGQVKAGVRTYKKHFKRPPAGIWLPECAYRPAYTWDYPVEGFGGPFDRAGVEEILYDNGIAYFIVDHHLLEGGKAIGTYAARFDALNKLWQTFSDQYTQIDGHPRSPCRSYFVSSREKGGKAVAILVRDPKTGLQVWSGEYGYPGDGQYLEFHKKHFPGGNRYWRVTGAKADLGDKQEYEPDKVEARIQENAGHYKELVKGTLLNHLEQTGQPGMLCAPYDAELFGHWWFEGPRFLYHTLKWIHEDPTIDMATGSEQLELHPPTEVLTLPEGSWGEGGYHFIWLNEYTGWTWKHIYRAEQILLSRLAEVNYKKDAEAGRILKQMARELLLLESSDWQFLISTFSARDYAESRLSIHWEDFQNLDRLLGRYLAEGQLTKKDDTLLKRIETRDDPFSDLDLSWWTK